MKFEQTGQGGYAIESVQLEASKVMLTHCSRYFIVISVTVTIITCGFVSSFSVNSVSKIDSIFGWTVLYGSYRVEQYDVMAFRHF